MVMDCCISCEKLQRHGNTLPSLDHNEWGWNSGWLVFVAMQPYGQNKFKRWFKQGIQRIGFDYLTAIKTGKDWDMFRCHKISTCPWI